MKPTDNLRSLHTAVRKGLNSIQSGDTHAGTKALELREMAMLEARGVLNLMWPLYDLHTHLRQSQPCISVDWGPQSSSIILRALGMTEIEPCRWGLMPERAWLGAKANEAFDFSFVFPASTESSALPLVRGASAEAGWAEALTAPCLPLPLEAGETMRIWFLTAGRHSEHPEGPALVLQLVFSPAWERLCQLRAADPARVLDLSDPALLSHLGKSPNPWVTPDLCLALDILKARDLEGLALAMALEHHPEFLEQLRASNVSSLDCNDPDIVRLLQPTRGCVVYQEQFLELCQRLGGWDLVRADRMRRSLGKGAASGAAEMMALTQDARTRGWNPGTIQNLANRMSTMPSQIGILKAHVLPMALQALEVAARTNPGG